MYNKVFLGGTFDLLHDGHKKAIKHASLIGKKVILGITSDVYVATRKPNLSIESFHKRKKAVEEFLKKSALHNSSIVRIEDALEPAASDPSLEAIVVSENTKTGAYAVNTKRKKRNLPKLDIIVIPMVSSQDGEVISSSRIRNGEINRNGTAFVNAEWKNVSFGLSARLRKSLKNPGGKLFKNYKDFLSCNRKNANRIVTVGDVCTKLLNTEKWNHPISVIDFIIERKKIYSRLSDLGFLGNERVFTLSNKAGTINGQLFDIPQEIFTKTKRTIIKINGEEDLVVLPLLLLAPLGWTIAYGQPHQGIVCVEVDEENKEKARKLVEAMKKL